MTVTSPQQQAVSPDPNEMYCRRLAEQAFAKLWKESEEGYVAIGPAICQVVFGSDAPLPVEAKESEIGLLTERLQEDAKLQQKVAALTDYVPSKWLLEQERAARKDDQGNPEWDGTGDIYEAVAKRGLLGVSLSGGGIRSATFNLGVLQALAQLGILPRIDYLSSVSGGGYIHQFLAGWLLRDPEGQDAVMRKLVPQAEPGCLPRSPEPIKWLVRYASYLTPARGWLTADTWTLISIWLRNTVLNQIPIVFGFAAAFCLVDLMHPQKLSAVFHFWEYKGTPPLLLLRGLAGTGILTLVWLVISIVVLSRNLNKQTRIASHVDGAGGTSAKEIQKLSQQLLTNRGVQIWLILPWLAGAVWVSFWAQIHEAGLIEWLPLSLIYLSILGLVLAVIVAGGAWATYKWLHEIEPTAPTAATEQTAATETPAPPDWWLAFRVVGGFVLMGIFPAAVACGMGWGILRGVWWLSSWLCEFIGPIVHWKHRVEGTGDFLTFSSQALWNGMKANLSGSVGRAGAGVDQGFMVDPWRIRLTLLPALLLSVPYMAIDLTQGLLGRDYSDARREWLARLRAWSLIYGLFWIIVVGLALLGPYLWYFIFGKGWTWVTTTLGAVGTSTLTTIFAGWSGKGDGKPTDKGLGYKPADLLALLAAPGTILGLLTLWSFLVCDLSERAYEALKGYGLPGYWVVLLAGLLFSFGVSRFFAWRLDINEFSMLSFYRNRLTRCYLGATLNNRQPDPFTGFDDRTKLRGGNVKARTIPPLMVELLPKGYWSQVVQDAAGSKEGSYQGPFPLFCTTINLTTGKDLATQERKGASFTFSPLYSGYSVSWTQGKKNEGTYNGFVPTGRYAYREGGIHLDTAVAISGAAANPNMGYNSNPALAFLMTFFNVRLGWWIANPRILKKWEAKGKNRPSPRYASMWLLRELFGMVDDSAEYVNLSDGGHFENMGLYELVRRRCKYIIVCDAEADAEMKFEGMGTAIAKCRMDFGAEIDLDLRPLRIGEDGYSQTHCVVGTIQYPPPKEEMGDYGVDGPRVCECLQESADDKYTGILVYLKASLVGDEPADLLAYKLRHDVFPHDMTGNQWFTETQFESYRRLGHHVALTALQPALSPQKTVLASGGNRDEQAAEMHALFQRMYAIWYPRTPEMVKYLGDHLKQFEGIKTELRARVELAGLEAALDDPRPWSEVTTVTWLAPSSATMTAEASRAYALQFAHSLLGFMYMVYTNLELAFPDNRVSPHADWWICSFRRWCRVGLVQDAWVQHVPMFPMEFRLFARRELRLPPRGSYVE